MAGDKKGAVKAPRKKAPPQGTPADLGASQKAVLKAMRAGVAYAPAAILEATGLGVTSSRLVSILRSLVMRGLVVKNARALYVKK